MSIDLKKTASRAANKWETGFLLSIIKRGDVELADWSKVAEDVGLPWDATKHRHYRRRSQSPSDQFKDENKNPPYDVYKKLLDELRPKPKSLGPDAKGRSIEELEKIINKKKDELKEKTVDLKEMKQELDALNDELEIKKEIEAGAMKVAADREKLDQKMIEMRKKAEEKLRQKKRKMAEAIDVIDDDDAKVPATVKVKKESR